MMATLYSGHCGGRCDESTGNNNRLGQGHRTTSLQCNRVAGYAHVLDGRSTVGPGAE